MFCVRNLTKVILICHYKIPGTIRAIEFSSSLITENHSGKCSQYYIFFYISSIETEIIILCKATALQQTNQKVAFTLTNCVLNFIKIERNALRNIYFINKIIYQLCNGWNYKARGCFTKSVVIEKEIRVLKVFLFLFFYFMLLDNFFCFFVFLKNVKLCASDILKFETFL